MSKHPEHDSEKPSDGKADDGSATPSRAELIRIKLKVVAHYAVLGFTPLVSATALTLAIVALVGNKSIQTALTQGTPKFESISTSLSESKIELAKIRAAMTEQSGLQAEERKKLDDKLDKIIQNVSSLQTKLKVSPTLDEQLRQPAGAPAAASIAPAPAVVAASPAPSPAKVVPAAIPKPVDEKLSPQGRAIKAAIEQFNKE